MHAIVIVLSILVIIFIFMYLSLVHACMSVLLQRFMPCRINVFSGRKRERSPRKKTRQKVILSGFRMAIFASPG